MSQEEFKGWGQVADNSNAATEDVQRNNQQADENANDQNGKNQNQQSADDEGKEQQNQQQQSNQNDQDDDDFNADQFTKDFKEKNPNATDEEVAAAVEKAEKDSLVIGADLFGETGDDKKPQPKKFSEQFKRIAKDDFDEVEHSMISTEEDFTEAVDKLVEKRFSKKLEENKVNQTYYDQLNEEGKAIFNAMKMKGLRGVQELITPNPRLQQMLQSSDEDLIIEAMKHQKDPENPTQNLYSDEEIEKRIAGLSDEDAAKEAKVIRGQIQKIYQDEMRGNAQRINQSLQKVQQQEQAKKEHTAKQMEGYLVRNADFYGLTVDTSTAKALSEGFQKGQFDGLMSDPVFLAKAILFHKIGDKAFRRHGKDQYEKGFNKKEANRHNANLPDHVGAGSSAQSASGSFKGWGR